jgi:hypothetical protein
MATWWSENWRKVIARVGNIHVVASAPKGGPESVLPYDVLRSRLRGFVWGATEPTGMERRYYEQWSELPSATMMPP